MSQYQKHLKIATCPNRIFLWFLCVLCLWAGGVPQPLFAADQAETPAALRRQTTPSDPAHLFLRPATETPLALLAHTADVRVVSGADLSLRLQMEVAYRLHNPEQTSLAAILEIAPPPATPQEGVQPQNIALTVDDQPLALQTPGAALAPQAQVEFGPDARRLLVLRYELPLASTEIFTFRYPITALRAWPAEPDSWRVTVTFADEEQRLARSDSWLQIAPNGWTFRAGRLQWLSEDRLPAQDVLLQVVHPQWMKRISATQAAIRSNNAPELLQQLGDMYTEIYQTPDVGASARQRLYAQALAAYSEALLLAQENGRTDPFLASVRYRLAALYRMRAIAADGSVDEAYVALMLAEAEQAVADLPPGPARQELENWLAQGLRQQLATARTQQNWTLALSLLDRLAQLPPDVANQAELAQERQNLLWQEALRLLGQGNEEAALALAGQEILAADLLPPPERRTLFANWQIVLTVSPQAVALDVLARPVADRRADARRALDGLLANWLAAGVPGVTLTEEAVGDETGGDETGGFRIRLERLDPGTRLLLAQNTPQISDWALLRSVLLAADAAENQELRLLWRRTSLTVEADLRAVGDEWKSVAAGLERAAATAAAEQSESASEQIRQSLRAAQHRQEALRWQRLVSDSVVQVQMQESLDEGAVPLRTWLLGLTDPPRQLSAQLEEISLARLWSVIGLGLLLIFLFAGLLWLLL